jgi:hypothetical protein
MLCQKNIVSNLSLIGYGQRQPDISKAQNLPQQTQQKRNR